jgi:hypothetical protein
MEELGVGAYAPFGRDESDKVLLRFYESGGGRPGVHVFLPAQRIWDYQPPENTADLMAPNSNGIFGYENWAFSKFPTSVIRFDLVAELDNAAGRDLLADDLPPHRKKK